MNIVEVGYRSEGAHQWLARLYQPEGSGPFPVLVDVHGGAWNGGDRMSDDFMNLRLAGSGILVMAIDFRLAPAHPYPAQAQDANYAFRWAKAHAAEYHGDPASVGALGASSGGHTVLLNALRPLDPLYAALELNETTNVDASLAYAVSMWGVLDSHQRYVYAKEHRPDLQTNTEAYFADEEEMRRGSPQGVLDRGESQALPPVLVIYGTADANVPTAIPERFIESYGQAGGAVESERFPGIPHGFANRPGSATDQALERVVDFVLRHGATSARTNI